MAYSRASRPGVYRRVWRQPRRLLVRRAISILTVVQPPIIVHERYHSRGVARGVMRGVR